MPFSRGIPSEQLGIDYDEALPSGVVESAEGAWSRPVAGRPDIDTAVLEELRRATVESSFPDPTRADRVRDDRADIDAAMLEALRRATISDPGVGGG